MATSDRVSLLPTKLPGVVTGVPDTALVLGLGLGSDGEVVQLLAAEV